MFRFGTQCSGKKVLRLIFPFRNSVNNRTYYSDIFLGDFLMRLSCFLHLKLLSLADWMIMLQSETETKQRDL